MAKCKFCGKPVKSAPVFHAKCVEAKLMEAAQQMCDEYCRWPHEVKNQRDLSELHCSECAVAELLRMGGNGV